jgi:SAM-dependent methyltransferase
MSGMCAFFHSLRALRRVYFNLWYFFNPPWDTGISPPELLDFLARHPPGRALDLGCGTGTNVLTLAQHGWQVCGVDFAWQAIFLARRKARQAGVQADLRVGDVTLLKGIHGPFDLVLDIGCFHSLPGAGRAAYLRNLTRILAPQGFFLLYAFLGSSAAGSPGLQPTDLAALESSLALVRRQDGQDRGQQPSAWFTFQPRDG